MAIEQTLSIVKPDAVGKNQIGNILDRLEKANLRIVAAKMKQISEEEARAFYAVHKERPFYDSLVRFMTSGPSLVMVLEGENAIQVNRTIMGATNPADASPGTIRADFASSIEENAVHGSDSRETAAFEVPFFFASEEICPRTR